MPALHGELVVCAEESLLPVAVYSRLDILFDHGSESYKGLHNLLRHELISMRRLAEAIDAHVKEYPTAVLDMSEETS